MANMLDMPDTTSYYSKSDIGRNRLMAALSYLSVLVLIPVFAAKDSPYARFHAAQGVNLLILSVLWAIIAAIIGAVFGAIGVGVLSVLWGIVFWVITIALALLMVIGILGALQGRARELPLIGGFRILK